MYLIKYKTTPYWQVVYSRNGKRTKISTKETQKSKALKFLTEFEAKLKERTTLQKVTFSLFKQQYISYLEISKSKSYTRSVKESLNEFEKYIGNKFLPQVSRRETETFILNKFQSTKYGAYSALRNLKAAFNRAIEWNYITINPFTKLNIPRIPTTAPLFIDENELTSVLEKTLSHLLKDVFITLFHTGLRAGELCNLEWSDIDFANRIICVKNKEDFLTKGRSDRSIPINDTILKILSKRFPKVLNINIRQFVFYRIPGVRLQVDYLSKNFKKAVRAAGLAPKVHLHTLRHSFASCLVQRGVSLYIVKELLGHTDLKTTQIYSHLQQNNLLEAVNLLNQQIK